MTAKGVSDFSQGIEGIRKQGYAMLDDPAQRKAGKKFLAQYDLRYLCHDILGYKDWDVIHDDIQEFLDDLEYGARGRQYRLLLIPRGHLKSSIVTIGWTIQRILNDPNVRILITHAIWDHARGFCKSMMQFMDGFSILPDLFGEFKPKHKGGRWSKDGFEINQRTRPLVENTVTTTGVERTQTGQHYDIMILDDVVADQNVRTPEQREKIRNFYRDCMSILEPNGIVIVVGTTWHEDDLYSSKDEDCPGLQFDPDYKVFKRVAETGTEESVLFKKKFDLEMLQSIKRKQGTYHYSAQYLLNPYPDEDMTFNKEWIHYWRFKSENCRGRVLDVPLYVALTIDPSMGRQRSDYAAIVAVGIDNLHNKYVLEAKHFKRKLEYLPEEVAKTIHKIRKYGYEVDVVGLESFGFQGSLLNPLRDGLKEAGIHTHVELLPQPKNQLKHKETRIEALIPNFANNEMYVREDQKDLLNELLRFNPTVRAKSDDIIDALAWNKIYWHRRPEEEPEPDYEDGSLHWWMNKKRRKEIDLFAEMR